MINETDFEFLQTVWSRRPLFTYIFFGINIVIFLLMTLAGGTTNDATLIAFGVKDNLLMNQGENWRFLTPVFIHIGLLHLFFNSYALWIVGPQVEKLYGSARFVILYVLTGVAGVAGSYWYRPEGLSAGASGAIFGLFGVLLVFGLRYRQHVPPFFSRAVGTGVLPVIIINLIIGFTIPAIDNSAHIAGLISGMALAAVVPFERPHTRTPVVFSGIQFALLALIVLCFFEVARHYHGPRLALQNVYRGWGGLIGTRSTTEEFITALNDAQNSFVKSSSAVEDNDPSEIGGVTGAVAKSIDELKAVPSLSSTSDQLISQLLALMQDQYALLQDIQHSQTVTLMQSRRASQNVRKYHEIETALDSWVDAEGQHYGIRQSPKR